MLSGDWGWDGGTTALLPPPVWLLLYALLLLVQLEAHGALCVRAGGDQSV